MRIARAPLAAVPSRTGYGERIVAIVDVLGASNALLSRDASRRFTEGLSRIVREKQEPWLVLPHVWTGEEVEIDNPHPVTPRTRVTAISDSVVISLPLGPRITQSERMSRIFGCLHSVAQLQRSLLMLGLKSRGGISIGGLVHRSDVVIGEALVRAHRLEAIVAKTPRAVIDELVVLELLQCAGLPNQLALYSNRVAHAVRQDRDGLYFVDYLAIDPIAGASNLRYHLKDIWLDLKRELRDEESPEILPKLLWLDRYIDDALSILNEPHPRQSHASEPFRTVYPRTADNLISWVDGIVAQRRRTGGVSSSCD